MRLILLPFLLFGIALAGIPALKSTISQRGLDKIKDIGVSIIRQQLTFLALPDIRGKTGTPIGDINYDLTNLQLNNIDFGQVAISPIVGKGLFVQMHNIRCHVWLRWHYSTWFASDSGTADVNVRDTTIQIAMDVFEYAERPAVTVESVKVSIGGLDIDLHGGASWLYQIFVNIFSGQIKDAVQAALRDSLRDTINEQAKEFLSTIPIEAEIDDVSVIDFGLEVPPTFTQSTMTTAVLGEFYAIHGRKECPAQHTPLPDPMGDAMVEVAIDPFLVNSASFVYWSQGGMSYDLDDKDVPPESPIRLNTSSFEELIPPLYEKYPNLFVHLHLWAADYPTLTVDKDGIHGLIAGAIDASVVDAARRRIHVFRLAVEVSVAGECHCEGNTLKGSVSFLQAEISLAESAIGDFDVEPLQDITDFLCTSGVLPTLNKYLLEGFPIPSVEGVDFVNPAIRYGDGYIRVSADIDYHP